MSLSCVFTEFCLTVAQQRGGPPRLLVFAASCCVLCFLAKPREDIAVGVFRTELVNGCLGLSAS